MEGHLEQKKIPVVPMFVRQQPAEAQKTRREGAVGVAAGNVNGRSFYG